MDTYMVIANAGTQATVLTQPMSQWWTLDVYPASAPVRPASTSTPPPNAS